MTEKQLIDMELHDSHSIYTNGSLTVTRVPGGWIYTRFYYGRGDNYEASMCFVSLPPIQNKD